MFYLTKMCFKQRCIICFIIYFFSGCNQPAEVPTSTFKTSEAQTLPVWISSSIAINSYSTATTTNLTINESAKASTSSKTFPNRPESTSFPFDLPNSIISSIVTNITTVTTKTLNAYLSAQYIAGIVISVFLFVLLFVLAGYYYFRHKKKQNKFFHDIFKTSSKSKNANTADTNTYSAIYPGKIKKALNKDHQDVSPSNSYETDRPSPKNNYEEVETTSGIKMTENILYRSYRSEKDVPTNDSSLSAKNPTFKSKAASSANVFEDFTYDVVQNVADSSEPSKMTYNILYNSYQAGVSENKNENTYEVVGNDEVDTSVLHLSSDCKKK